MEEGYTIILLVKNELLKEYVKLVPDKYVLDKRQRVERDIEHFRKIVTFLSNKEKFPNPNINKLADFTHKYIEGDYIPQTLTKSNFPLTYTIPHDQTYYQDDLTIFPGECYSWLMTDPVRAYMHVVFFASYVRDDYTRKLSRAWEDDEKSYQRGLAYSSEMLLTIQKIAQKEGKTIEIDDIIACHALNIFPEGLRSLPEGLDYPTPLLKPRT